LHLREALLPLKAYLKPNAATQSISKPECLREDRIQRKEERGKRRESLRKTKRKEPAANRHW